MTTIVRGFDTTPESRKAFIDRVESGVYNSTNDKGEQVIVYVDQYSGMDVETWQSNGWIQISSYDENGCLTDDLIGGRWNK